MKRLITLTTLTSGLLIGIEITQLLPTIDPISFDFQTNAIAQTSMPQSKEQVIRERVNQWEAAWNIGNKPFSMSRFGDLYVQDDSLLAYDLTSPKTPSIIRGYQRFAKTWEPFMQAFSPWNVKINNDLVIHAGDRVSVATFTWAFSGKVKADGQPVSGNLHATLVFENRGGKWQIVHEHVSTPVRDTAVNPS
jgi:ketosteroid isomerase-like protein